MRHLSVLLLLLLFGHAAKAQTTGIIINSEDSTPVVRAHIQNLSNQNFTVSNEEGRFRLPIALGDSIWISSVGYESSGFIIGQQWAQMDTIQISLNPSTLKLDEITVNALPSEALLKQRILKYSPEDTSMHIRGLPEIPEGPKATLLDSNVKSIGFALSNPFGFLYHNLSKKEKEKRQMYRIKQDKLTNYRSYQKFNREIVAEITMLKGHRLTDFIAYCNFTQEFILKSTSYQLAEAIREKLDEFQKNQEG